MGAQMVGHRKLKNTTDRLAAEWSGTFRFETYTDVEYAAHMEFGTRRHPIVPRRAEALRFVVDGRLIVTTYVDHPGTEPRPFMRPGAEGAARQIRPIVAANDDLEGIAEALAEKVAEIARMLAPRETGRLAASIRVRRVY